MELRSCRIVADSAKHDVYLQWIQSHVGIYGNDSTDSLAKQVITPARNVALTFTEMFFIKKRNVQNIWKISPIYRFYFRDEPGHSLIFRKNKGDQTAFTRFITDHIKCLKFERHHKVSPISNKSFFKTASPTHLQLCEFFKGRFFS